MKFLHLADLHIGRRLNGYSLIDDQKKVLNQALDIIDKYKCDAIMIAGDIYDKPSPPANAMQLFDSFASSICSLNKKIYMISGNHDSAERISYYSGIIRNSGIYTTGQFSGILQSYDTEDNITIHLLPFIKPLYAKQFYPEITTYEDAVKAVIEHSNINKNRINILICHQFITGGTICQSEEFSVGGLDNINSKIFNDFDYVALGHLHKAQYCGRETLRYSGSPLKYSISEEEHKKTFTVVDINGKNNIKINEIPINLPHNIKTIKGNFENLIKMPYTQDYIKIILTDEIVPPDSRIFLRSIFPNMLQFSVENSKTKYVLDIPEQEKIDNKNKIELFKEFYAFQNNNSEPDERQVRLAEKIFSQLEETEQ